MGRQVGDGKIDSDTRAKREIYLPEKVDDDINIAFYLAR
jgi:hypothetical protein